MKKILMFAFLLTLPLVAWAKPEVVITVNAKQKVVVEENGKKITKLIDAKDVTPGSLLVYQLHYKNIGDSTAVGAALVNPVPDNTLYIDGSAFGPGSTIDFSIDRGEHYKKPSLLTYQVDTGEGKLEKRVASPEQYTHIRWTVQEIPAGKSGEASFQVRVQ